MSKEYFIGVDVGSASVRAGLYSLQETRFIKTATEPISIHRQTFVCHQNRTCETISQSSGQIWNAVCRCVRSVTSKVDAHLVKGIGFDATCSLVVVDSNAGKPISVIPTDVSATGFAGNLEPNSERNLSQTREHAFDIIMWQDHRAKSETDFINEALQDHIALKFVGGKVSVEMELPKILWIKKYLPNVYQSAEKFMDLCDFLTWKATNSDYRSVCSVVCKWLYQINPEQPTQQQWDPSIFTQIGLEDLCQNNFEKIGINVRNPGERVGNGLSKRAANEMNLPENTPVAVGIIDAHAGALALSFCSSPTYTGSENHTPLSRLSLICGTSTCFMISSDRPLFVPGVWGPYYSAIIPQSWSTEGGQSSAGQFLDHIIQTHPYYLVNLEKMGMNDCYSLLNQRVKEIAKKDHMEDFGHLSDQLHIFPDFHGNRSPLSAPSIRGLITGLTLDGSSEHSLIRLYIAALQSLAYESKWIIEVMGEHGVRVTSIAVCGGLSLNPLFVRTLTDIVGKPVMLPEIQESVTLGAAILAATASGTFKSVQTAAAAMAGKGSLVEPNPLVKAYHEKRYKIFRKLAKLQFQLMNEGLPDSADF
ncbi:FGGY carbohydrate kinase domain-containing protein-like [Paramacrobiotus metropolitanus]|uniref:FGGY carbohydrate kinase domain-containing protein-like n=1 Tax=Paramacrobiotus metropolitanus TaxID=2943436 RepID=UPI002445B7BF|nr:FGGY carbohydrate kinase domain-containing protein-like [Paramacrobiotus metropolitanus]